MRQRPSSSLHLQLGQETIYLLLTGGLFAAFMLALYVASLRGQEKQPPIVRLTESQGYTFPTGSAEIGAKFGRQLRDVIAPTVRRLATEYDAPVIEVVGHTDEVPLGSGRSDLDRTLIRWLHGGTGTPVAGDNVGLGMARAVAVARALRAAGLGNGYTIIPLSAGPLVKLGDHITDGRRATDEQNRRRIELRLRRPNRE